MVEILKGEDFTKLTRYKGVLELEKIKPHELLVIGNDFEIDIIPAQKLGARTLHIYGPNFDIESIKKMK